MRIKEEWRDKRRNLMPGLHNTYVFIFMYLAKDKKTLESCGILQSTVRSNIWSNCRNIVDWKERMTTVASWQDKWRFAKSLWYKWLNAEFSSAKNPFDRSEIYTINNLAHIVFSRMNMTIAYTGTSSYKYDGPELQFDYKLGSTVVFESGPLGLPLITRNTGWIFILATIFEETGHVPNKIARLTPFRLTFGLWCLMSVVLTNCYNGLMISDLNAPLPSFKARTFNDLVCNKVPRSETDKHIEGKGIAGPYRNSFAELFFYIYDVEWHKLNYIIRSPEFLFFLYDQVFRQGLKMTKFQQDIEREVVKCGKSVFVAYSDVLEAEYAFLSKHYPWHEIYKGREIYNIASYGVIFRLAGISKIPGYFKSLVETGIYGRVEEEIALRKNLKRKPASFGGSRDDSLGLGTALATFFILWGVALSASLPVFAFELFQQKVLKLGDIYKNYP
ncbi:hypothetical protein Fcan01_28110 [Folsomia candida]|uniref:Uncharacterized protein n=1 Tax=Folsomia candida TaxID=158441 RepID=A0A226CWY6_FOLCA|nr:hypothetical protein Fcan01_28110 [Folsomia candida]